MKPSFVLFFILAMQGAGFAQAYDWVRSFGNNGDDKGLSIDVDNAGNCYVTGIFQNTITIGTYTLTSVGNSDVYVAKYNSSGILQWAFAEGGVGVDEAYGIACDASGNFAITGLYTSTPLFGNVTLTTASSNFLAYYDNAGNFQWVREFGSPGGGYAWDIDMDATSAPVVVGYYSTTSTFGATTLNANGIKEGFVIRYFANGNFDWVKSLGGAAEDVAYAVNTDANGNIYVTGRISGTVSFGTITLVGTNSSNDIFLAKLNSLGVFVWAVRGGGTNSDSGQGVDVDGSGNIVITGFIGAGTSQFGATVLTSNGLTDAFAARYTSSGALVWAKNYGGAGDDYGSDLSLAVNGFIFLSGFYNGTASFGNFTVTSAGGRDVLTLFLDTAGVELWILTGGGIGDEYVRSVSAGGGYVFVAGMNNANAVLIPFSITNSGANDAFVARIKYSEVGIAESESGHTISLVPNPVTSELTFVSEAGFHQAVINIYDAAGKIVFTRTMNSENRFSVDVSLFAPGLYTAIIQNNEGEIYSERFIRN